MRLGVLIRSDLIRSARRLLTVGAAVMMSVAFSVLLLAIGSGLKRAVEPFLPELPLDLIRVEAKTLSASVFSFGSSAGLDEGAIARLEALPGVERVHAVRGAGFPLRAEGGDRFLGQRLRTDLFATGLDPDLVRGDVAPGRSFEDPGPGQKRVPVLVARRLLDLYNTTVAPAINRPKLSESAVIGFSFEIVLGSSYVLGTPHPGRIEAVTAEVVGFSPLATLVGMTVPKATLERWNQTHGDGRSPIVGAYVVPARPQDAAQIADGIERLGFSVDETMKIASTALWLGGSVLGLFALLVLSLSAFAIMQTFFLLVSERRFELAVLRAMGARRSDVRRMVVLEALVVGVVASALGLALGAGLACLVDWALRFTLPDMPFRPSSFVAFPPIGLLAAFVLGVAAAWVGAWVPAALAARVDPGAALRV